MGGKDERSYKGKGFHGGEKKQRESWEKVAKKFKIEWGENINMRPPWKKRETLRCQSD